MLLGQLIPILDGCGNELINSGLENAIAKFRFLDSIDGFLDFVNGLKEVTFGIDHGFLITDKEEHLS